MKNTLLIAGICLIVLAVGAALYFGVGGMLVFSRNTAAVAGETKAPVVVLGQGNAVSTAPKVNYRILTQNKFNKIWSIAYGSSTPPTVDFSKNDVLAVFDGSHATSGYSISIANVADGVAGRVVTIRHFAPGKGCVKTPCTSEPFEFVMVPTSMLSISHLDVNATTSCNS